MQASRPIGQAKVRPARLFRDFLWSTKQSWSRRRRVIGKAEWTRGEASPRFLVTSLKAAAWRAKPLLYCAVLLVAGNIRCAAFTGWAHFWVSNCAPKKAGIGHLALPPASC